MEVTGLFGPVVMMDVNADSDTGQCINMDHPTGHSQVPQGQYYHVPFKEGNERQKV